MSLRYLRLITDSMSDSGIIAAPILTPSIKVFEKLHHQNSYNRPS
ncbi:hypothetical protein [Clostridium botulinum]|nr:hypothetical protein [Clostridium botulinum]